MRYIDRRLGLADRVGVHGADGELVGVPVAVGRRRDTDEGEDEQEDAVARHEATIQPMTRSSAHMPPNRAAVFSPLWCLCMSASNAVGVGRFVPSGQQAQEQPGQHAEQHEDTGADDQHRGRPAMAGDGQRPR